jgi:hypothetical protein
MENKKLLNNYYSTKGYWRGNEAIVPLSIATGVDKDVVKKWLEKQALWQIYLPRPKYIPRWHWDVEKVNEVHQSDLLFLTHDKVGNKTYKYALLVVDVASRYADAEPLTSKDSSGLAIAFERIYKRKLKYPTTLVVDPGTEFMGAVTKLMEKNKTKIQRSEAKNHRAQAIVERVNRTLAEKLYSHQYAQEMLMEDERSREWVKRLPDVLKSINSRVKRITGKAAIDAVRQKEVPEKHVQYKRSVGTDEKRLPAGVKVRYLYQPGEYEGGDNQRATDPNWSFDVFDIERTVVANKQPVLYYLSEGAPRRNFVREELQVVPEDTELPPKAVLQ